MVVLDTTIVNVALPHIQQGLGLSSGGLSWVLNAYILTFGGCSSSALGPAISLVDAASS
jgi:MFS family permease